MPRRRDQYPGPFNPAKPDSASVVGELKLKVNPDNYHRSMQGTNAITHPGTALCSPRTDAARTAPLRDTVITTECPLNSEDWLTLLDCLRRRSFRCLALLLLAFFMTGCAEPSTTRRFGNQWRDSTLSAVETQSALMSLSDKVMFTIADACDVVFTRADTPDSRTRAARLRLSTRLAALSAASGPNPYVGLVDLVTMVMLQRMWLEEPWAADVFSDTDRLALLTAFATAERDVWSHADRVLTQQQQRELRELIVQWRAENPDRHDLSWVRLQEFATARQAGASGQVVAPSSILSLLWIDPSANLTPATRELQESRLLAERLAFFAKRTPVILGWQVELTTTRVMGVGEMRQLVENSTRFTDSLSEFTASTRQLVASYDRTLDELPKERAAAIEQLDTALSRQVSDFIEKTTTAFNMERTTTVEQLGHEFAAGLQSAAGRLAADFEVQSAQTLERMNAILAKQQDQLSSGLSQQLAQADAASRRLIDRIAMRLFLVIVAGAFAIACISVACRAINARIRSPSS